MHPHTGPIAAKHATAPTAARDSSRLPPSAGTGSSGSRREMPTQVYALDDRVRVTVPDPADPDHRYDGATGQIVGLRRSPLSPLTGDPRDDYLYRVALEATSTEEMLFRHTDLMAVRD